MNSFRRSGSKPFLANRLTLKRVISVYFAVAWLCLYSLCFCAQSFASDKMMVNVVETAWLFETNDTGSLAIITAKVILPDGSHADLLCGTHDKCAAIEPIAPEKMPPDSRQCDNGTIPHQTSCKTRNLGMYQATRKVNKLTIFAPNGKLTFTIVGSW